jgi:hypothetical protein
LGLLIDKDADVVTVSRSDTNHRPARAERVAMFATGPHAASEQVRDLLRSVGGDMEWLPGGGHGGGAWELTLRDRNCRVQVRDNQVNDLDGLYVSKVDNPTTWGITTRRRHYGQTPSGISSPCSDKNA